MTVTNTLSHEMKVIREDNFKYVGDNFSQLS